MTGLRYDRNPLAHLFAKLIFAGSSGGIQLALL